jgi:ABC-type multidrug transport system ATPase subunit
VLDEPTSMLDPRGREEIIALLRSLNEGTGTTVILITQSMDEAASARRTVVLNGGRVAMDGPPAKIFAETETLLEMGLGVPHAAELAALLRSAGIPIAGAPLTIEELSRLPC